MKWILTNYQRDYIIHERDRIFKDESTFEESNKLVWQMLLSYDSFSHDIDELVWYKEDDNIEEFWRVNHMPRRIQYMGFRKSEVAKVLRKLKKDIQKCLDSYLEEIHSSIIQQQIEKDINIIFDSYAEHVDVNITI